MVVVDVGKVWKEWHMAGLDLQRSYDGDYQIACKAMAPLLDLSNHIALPKTFDSKENCAEVEHPTARAILVVVVDGWMGDHVDRDGYHPDFKWEEDEYGNRESQEIERTKRALEQQRGPDALAYGRGDVNFTKANFLPDDFWRLFFRVLAEEDYDPAEDDRYSRDWLEWPHPLAWLLAGSILLDQNDEESRGWLHSIAEGFEMLPDAEAALRAIRLAPTWQGDFWDLIDEAAPGFGSI